jgi:hypothetical protein
MKASATAMALSPDSDSRAAQRDGVSLDIRGADLLVLTGFALVIPFVFGTLPEVFDDGDVSWHIAAGRWMIAHRAIPFADPFSYTSFGKPWMAHEWLSEAIMGLVFNTAGWTGIALLTALSLAATFVIIGLRLSRWAPPVELCAVLLVIALALYPFMLARPMVFTWPLLAWWIDAVLRARERDRLPPLYLIPLTTLWVNLHASFAVGLGILALFGLEALIEAKDRTRTFWQWALFGGACGLAALANPHGLTGALLPLGVFGSQTVTLILEFRPTVITEWPSLEFALVLFIGLALLRGARLTPVRVLILLVMLHLALAHVRHQALLTIAAGLIALPAMTRRWVAGEAPLPSPLAALQARFGKGAVIAAGAALLAAACLARAAWPVVPRESKVNASRALASIPPHLRRRRVLNEYSIGGPLILRGIPVFMDGRTDVHGDAHFLLYNDIILARPEALHAAQQRWNFCWSIFRKSDEAVVKLLDRSPGWRRFYADDFVVMHARDACRGT